MCPWVSSVLLLNKNRHWVDASLLPKQYSHFMQEGHVDAGNGPGAPGPDGGLHRPIAVMYLAPRCALGIADSFSTSSIGKTM